MGGHSNVKVVIDSKGAERAIRKFKRMCENFGILREYRIRKEYKKPSVKRKEKNEASQKRLVKNARRQERQDGRKKI
jgi:small subunit ribosomal protein S21